MEDFVKQLLLAPTPSRRGALLFALLSSLTLAACPDAEPESNDSEPDSPDLAGTYNGSMAIYNSDPPAGVNMTLTIEPDGTLVGTTTSIVAGSEGEPGSIWGRVLGDDPMALDVELAFDAPSAGPYAITGKAIFDTTSGALSGNALTAKQDEQFVGQALWTVAREGE